MSYNFNEIQNKHGQDIYLFSKQPGKTEMEKFLNFLKIIKEKYKIFEETTINNQKIKIVATHNSFDVFNDKEEKIAEYIINFDNAGKINTINDILVMLYDLGFEIK